MSDESRATFTLRASRDLLDRLKSEAENNAHSVNAEIVQRLENSLSKKKERPDDQLYLDLKNIMELQKVIASNVIIHLVDEIIKNDYKIDGMSPKYLENLRISFSSGLAPRERLKDLLENYVKINSSLGKGHPEIVLQLLREYDVDSGH